MGKPASITSTPSASRRRARRSFSAVFMEKPGACSPSLSVVSKIRTISIAFLLLKPKAPSRGAPTGCVRGVKDVQFILLASIIRSAYILPCTRGALFGGRPEAFQAWRRTRHSNNDLGFAMDLSELNVFLTVARERSFSRAAQKLFRTQPAVSIAIRKLEDEVGEPLFARGARSGQLTDAGRLLLGYAERILNLRDEIRRAVDDLRTGGRGELSLGVNESSIHALLPVLARYRQIYPQVHLAVRRTFSRDIPTELLNYRLDLGEKVRSEEHTSELQSRRDLVCR